MFIFDYRIAIYLIALTYFSDNLTIYFNTKTSVGRGHRLKAKRGNLNIVVTITSQLAPGNQAFLEMTTNFQYNLARQLFEEPIGSIISRYAKISVQRACF